MCQKSFLFLMNMRAPSSPIVFAALAVVSACLALWKSRPAPVCPVTKTPLTPEQLADASLLATRPDGSTATVCCEGCIAAVQSGLA